MIKKKLKNDVMIVHYSDFDLIIYDNKSLKICLSNEEFKNVYALLKKGTSLMELTSLYPTEDVKVLWESLLKIGALIEEWENSYENTIYEKQLYYLESLAQSPIHLQETLSTKCVAIIGVGGVGSIILEQLIRFGIQNYILIDDDEVQIHNLNRQYMYTLKDVGFSKVDVCFTKIKEFHPDGQVSIFKKRIKNQDDLSKIFAKSLPDLVINAADEPHNLNQEVLKVCIEYQVPFLTGSVGISSGRVGPFIDQSTCMSNYLDYLESVQLPKNIKTIKPILGSLGSSNCIISSLIAYDAIRFLLKKQPNSFNKILHVNFNDLPFKATSINKVEEEIVKHEN